MKRTVKFVVIVCLLLVMSSLVFTSCYYEPGKLPKFHIAKDEPRLSPTCTTPGHTAGKYCIVCGDIIQGMKYIEANGHTVVYDKGVAPTCTKSGISDGRHCSVCGKIITARIVLSPTHTVVKDPALAPTCTTIGHTEGKHCSVCNEVLVPRVVIDPIDHSFVGGTCTRCGQSIETIDKIYTVRVIDQNGDAVEGIYVQLSYDGMCIPAICTDASGKISVELAPGKTVDVKLYDLDGYTIPAPVNGDYHAVIAAGETEVTLVLEKVTSSNTTGSLGLEYAINSDGKTCTITGIGDCLDTEVVIPTVINGYSVTSIGATAFKDCTSLKSVTIPETVESIGDYAFYWCLSLASVTIPNGVKSIGEWAFGSTALTTIAIPDSVTIIGDLAFIACDDLQSITIPKGVTKISAQIFSYCDNLTQVTISDSVTSIDSFAFAWCESLTSITIPDGVNSIGYGAFEYCTSLTRITFKGTVEQWNAISFGTDWRKNVPATNVICSNGVVTLN